MKLPDSYDEEGETEKETEAAATGWDHRDESTAEEDGDRGCPKCGHTETAVDEIATTGSGLSKFFDIQNRKFQVISCTNCGYSELYRSGDADVIVDLFLG